jgi:hypothetical protein
MPFAGHTGPGSALLRKPSGWSSRSRLLFGRNARPIFVAAFIYRYFIIVCSVEQRIGWPSYDRAKKRNRRQREQ